MYTIRELNRKEFPSQLFEIPQPPKKLFLAGELPGENVKLLCIVGSRKCTSYGIDACEKIIEGLRGFPVAIVSGLALGIDAIAHKSAMKAGLPTIAVPGSGLSQKAIYPRMNLRLAEEIVENGGALLSEFEPDFRATQWSFPQRNRIMAGLSHTILIVEAEERSGTLITARLSTEYNKNTCVIPNGIFSTGSRGSNKLLKQGAYPITEANDLLELFGFQTEAIPSQEMLFDLSPEEKKIFEILSEPLPRDELIRISGFSAPDANTLFSIMEIKGIIVEKGGEFRRTM